MAYTAEVDPKFVLTYVAQPTPGPSAIGRLPTTPRKTDATNVETTKPKSDPPGSTPTLESISGTRISRYELAKKFERPARTSVESVLPRFVTSKWMSSRVPTKSSSLMSMAAAFVNVGSEIQGSLRGARGREEREGERSKRSERARGREEREGERVRGARGVRGREGARSARAEG